MAIAPRRTLLSIAAVGGLTVGLLGAQPASVAIDEGALPDRIVLNPTPTPATSQEVTWRTDSEVADGWVEYEPSAGGARRRAEAADPQAASALFVDTDAHHHSAVLEGLVPDTSYDYRVGTDAGWSEWHTFTSADATLDAGDDPWTFLYFGDAQNGLDDQWPPVVDAAFAAYPDAELTVHAGDQINDAHDDVQWGQWFAGLGDHLAETQTVTTLGNHELTIDPGASQYRAHYEYPHNGPITQDELVWYTDYQGVRFISLNGNAPLGGALDQAPWLEDVLGDNPSRWTVVTFHQPMFSNTDGRDNVATRNAWLPIFEEYGVDLVLQGHDHTYARGHLTENENPDGSVTGPVYTVAVGGSKYYEPSAEGDNNWTDNDATRVVSHGETSTFQAITVTDDTLTYRAVVGAEGEAGTAPGGIGSTIDAFTITRDAAGATRVVAGEHTTVRASAPATPYGGRLRLRATAATLAGDPVTAGEVEVRDGDRLLGTAPVGAGGAAVLALDAARLGVGTHDLTVTYPGADRFRAAAADVTVRVGAAATRATLTARRLQGRRGTAAVRLTTAARPTGRLVVERRVEGRWRRIAAIRATGARTTVPLRRLPRTRVVLRARYLGDARTAPAQARTRLPRR